MAKGEMTCSGPGDFVCPRGSVGCGSVTCFALKAILSVICSTHVDDKLLVKFLSLLGYPRVTCKRTLEVIGPSLQEKMF